MCTCVCRRASSLVPSRRSLNVHIVHSLYPLVLKIFVMLQLWTMCRTKTSDGFSLGVTFFDLTGSTLSIAVMLLQHRHALKEVQPGSIGPYGVIIALQVSSGGLGRGISRSPLDNHENACSTSAVGLIHA